MNEKCRYILPPDRFWKKERACYYTGRHVVNGQPYCKPHAAIVARQLGAETPEQVKAERDDLKAQLAEAEANQDHILNERQRMIEIQREARQKLEADNAALVNGLSVLFTAIDDLGIDPPAWMRSRMASVDDLFNHPHPGAPMLDLLRAFETLENAIRAEMPPEGYGFVITHNALADLDAIRNREGCAND